jgi:hypothetical protein
MEAVDHAENRRGHADPQRERDHHEGGKRGRAAKAADRGSRILQQIFDEQQSSLGAIVFLNGF